VGFRKIAILYKNGRNRNIWIEGKRAYKCNLLKFPEYGIKSYGEKLFLQEVKGDGKILVMNNGSIYEVNDIYTINTSLWLGMTEVLIIDDYELVNLEEGEEIIEVTRIK